MTHIITVMAHIITVMAHIITVIAHIIMVQAQWHRSPTPLEQPLAWPSH
jgi:hypothetical protein